MKLAHLILAYNNPAQLLRLVKHLVNSEADVFIHLDKKTDIKQFASVQAFPGVNFINNRVLITWANSSMVQACKQF